MEAHGEFERARYAWMRWNTPLSESHAEQLVARLEAPPGGSVLDLGCGWGELLLHTVQAGSQLSGVGVDTDEELLARGRALAEARGLGDRVRFVTGAAAEWERPADAVLCIGSSHAWGGTESALAALRHIVAPGGRLLFGDGCWERAPTKVASALFGDGVLELETLLQRVLAAGWRPLHMSVADQREWDEFELSWTAGRQRWLLAHPNDERAPGARRELDERLVEYVSAYRGVLGFCYLILGH
jgi:SAM-dependent methyltransferase